MSDAPAIMRVEQRRAAIVKLVIPRAEMPQVMRPAIGELVATLRAQGIAPAGPLFAHHLRMDDAVFDFELGLPTERPVAPAGRVQPGHLPGGRIARAIHRGGYEGLPDAWGRFRRWLAEHGHECRADLWEVYAAGPEHSANPAEWRTELNQPLCDA